MAFQRTFFSMANVGHYPRALFQPAEWLPTLNEQGYYHGGINRNRWVKSTWWDQDALGKHSGPEIWEDHEWFENLGMGEEHEVDLFGIQFSENLYDNTPAVIMKVCRTSTEYQRSFGGRLIWGIDVKTHAYKRVYTDETHWTDTELHDYNYGQNTFIPTNAADTDARPNLFLEFYPYAGDWYMGLSCSFLIVDQNNPMLSAVMGMYDLYNPVRADFDALVTSDDPPSEEFDPDFGPAAEPEGYSGGTFDDHSDTVDYPSDPQSIMGLGFINVYKCPVNALIDFGAALFPEITWPQSLSEVGEVLAAFSDSVWNAKLIDYVISVHVVPGDVPAGALEDIKIGARTMTGIMGRKISSEYVTFDFGSIETARVFRNYADVMTSCKIFLPFYGYVNLPPEYWNGCTLSLKYKFNVIDGSFMAFLKASDCYYSKLNGVIGQYGGSAIVHMPVTGVNYATMFSAAMGSGAQIAAGGKGAMLGAPSSMINVLSMQGGGGGADGSTGYNASANFMGMRRPFLLIELPVPQFPTKYASEQGFPANITYVLGTLHGLVKCTDPRVEFACSDQEAVAIVEALKEGVIL